MSIVTRIHKIFWLLLAILFVFSHLAIPLTRAELTDLPTRPTDIATATPTPAVTAVPVHSQEIGASIQLQVAGTNNHPGVNLFWTVVQWQDAHGGWHTVDGWQGTLDDGVHKTWWVAPKDFATGPFRWVVYEERDGDLLAASYSFQLPDQISTTVVQSVNIAP